MITPDYRLSCVVMATTHAPRFLSVSEAAIQLGVSVPTLRRWIRNGYVTAAQPAGEQGVLRIPEAELDRLAEEAR
jgi:excisionase family DNA binding protein